MVISGKINNLGGGIYIGDTNEVSKIENTIFSYLNGYNYDKDSEYIILGSVNFHQTKAVIRNVNFNKIYSEDAINIFRSDFNINEVYYSDISSDAIDIDFSNGIINRAKFEI